MPLLVSTGEPAQWTFPFFVQKVITVSRKSGRHSLRVGCLWNAEDYADNYVSDYELQSTCKDAPLHSPI